MYNYNIYIYIYILCRWVPDCQSSSWAHLEGAPDCITPS